MERKCFEVLLGVANGDFRLNGESRRGGLKKEKDILRNYASTVNLTDESVSTILSSMKKQAI
ncbi:MAG: hypothetical protein ACE5EK_10730, partial [Nitrospinales bacterium]